MIGGQTVSNGIYILHTNGKLYTSDKWNYSWRNDAVGVALISDNSSFVISGIELKRCMSLIDGLDIDEGTTSYWTSTQYNYEKAWLVTYNGNEFYPNDERKGVSFYAIRVISQLK